MGPEATLITARTGCAVLFHWVDGSVDSHETDTEGGPMASQRHRVVVVGGGFGGLNVTRALNRAEVDVTLVDRTNHHLFQPLLYQVAAGIMPPGLIAPALRAVIKKQANARALMAEVHD